MLLTMVLLACGELREPPPEPACAPRVSSWADADGDGVGGSATVYVGCEVPAGYAAEGGDCDDADATVTTGCDTGADTSDTSDTSDTADTSGRDDSAE